MIARINGRRPATEGRPLRPGVRAPEREVPEPALAIEEVAPPAEPKVPDQAPVAARVAPVPRSVEETGLDISFIADLALKIIYYNNHVTARSISEQTCLPYPDIIEKALMLLRREQLIEVTGGNAISHQEYQFAATQKGVGRVHQVLERTTYVGPAPVTLDQYTTVVKTQAMSADRVNPDRVREAMADLVLEDRTIDAMGRAVNTGRSLFLFGPPGNGKTMLAEHIVPLLGGAVLIPHAMTVDGQIIKVLDLHNHQPLPVPEGIPAFDRRFVLCRRPAIVVGGELTLDVLDLVYDRNSKTYEAPLQVKANGGMFLIDDFGRQLVEPRQLLNRWIVPLEKRLDYLTLHTGKKIEIPFDQIIVFSTNLAPKDLVDEAFLRRIQSKLHVGDPSPETFREIFRRQCEALGVPFDEAGYAHLLHEHYAKTERPFRAVHPRDILRTLVGMSRYQGMEPVLSPELIDRACETYFVKL